MHLEDVGEKLIGSLGFEAASMTLVRTKPCTVVRNQMDVELERFDSTQTISDHSIVLIVHQNIDTLYDMHLQSVLV